jgi:pimeloyl-ACP methyl ester carboxylesterase
MCPGPSVVPQGDTTAERPVLVAVHGGPGLDHMTVKSALGPLAEDFQVLYFDLRGHGRSDHSSAKFWNVRTWADDLRRLCDALGLRQPVVLGRVQPRLLPALQRHARLGRGIRPVPGSDDQEPGRQLAL